MGSARWLVLSPEDQLSSREGREGRGCHSTRGRDAFCPGKNELILETQTQGRGWDSDSRTQTEGTWETDGRVSSDASSPEPDQKRARGMEH